MGRHATVAAPPEGPAVEDGAILSPKQTYQFTSLSGATIWRLRQRGQFPDPVQLSPGRMGWRRRDVARWLAERQDIAHQLRPSPNPKARPVQVLEPVRRRRRGRHDD